MAGARSPSSARNDAGRGTRDANSDAGRGTRTATRSAGHRTRDADRDAGRGTRDTNRDAGRGTRDADSDAGRATRDALARSSALHTPRPAACTTHFVVGDGLPAASGARGSGGRWARGNPRARHASRVSRPVARTAGCGWDRRAPPASRVSRPSLVSAGRASRGSRGSRERRGRRSPEGRHASRITHPAGDAPSGRSVGGSG